MTEPLVVQLTAEQLVDMVAARVVAILKNGNGHAAEDDRLLDVEEAAKVLAVKPRWLYGRAAAGALPFVVRLPGRVVRFSAHGIDEYIAKRMGR